MKASVLVATYEMTRHLELVCAGLIRQDAQSSLDSSAFEVLFCDDGSGPETRALIESFAQKSRFPVQHLWQEHQGFRKCKILNQALRKARGETVIFLDGDCVPHRSFVRDHIEAQENGYYLAGRRVEIGKRLSARLTPERVRNGFFDWPRPALIASMVTGDSEYLNRALRVPSEELRRLLKMDRIVDLKGCNYSVPRSALEAINGFDESYEGYGREDTDVEMRLQNLGLKIKSLKGLALQFHIWHPRREFTPENDQRLQDLVHSKRFRCENGLFNRR